MALTSNFTSAKAAATGDEKPAAADKAAEKPKRDTYPLYGAVVAVSPKLLTIKGGEGKEDRKYAITAETTFNNAGKPATLADVVVGKKVGGLLKKSETGNDKVVSLNVGVAQEAKPKKAKADGDKKGASPGEAEPAKSATKKKAA